MEHEIDETKSLVLQSSQAAEQAKAAVAQNAHALQAKLAERQKLLSQLDQAKMQEQMNTAMSSLGETVGEDVPELRRDPRQDRGPLRQGQGHGRAQHRDRSATACSRSSAQSMNSEAQDRLTEIRSQLGLPPSADAASSSADGAAARANRAGRVDAGADSEPHPPHRRADRRPPAPSRPLRGPGRDASRRPVSRQMRALEAVDQGRTTRSSRWTTQAGDAVGQVGAAPAGDLRPPPRRRAG